MASQIQSPYPNSSPSSVPAQLAMASQIQSPYPKNIFHKNREISILTIKKKTARLTLLQEATERTRQGETQNKTKHEKHTAVNESASLTPIQGPSTVACMIVT
jgi:hypothetical protein